MDQDNVIKKALGKTIERISFEDDEVEYEAGSEDKEVDQTATLTFDVDELDRLAFAVHHRMNDIPELLDHLHPEGVTDKMFGSGTVERLRKEHQLDYMAYAKLHRKLMAELEPMLEEE